MFHVHHLINNVHIAQEDEYEQNSMEEWDTMIKAEGKQEGIKGGEERCKGI